MAIIRTSRAEQDLYAIWKHIAGDNLAAADRLIRSIDEKIQLLDNNPDLGHSVDRYREGLRASLVRNYIIFYQKTDDGILIYRVLHGARDLDQLL